MSDQAPFEAAKPSEPKLKLGKLARVIIAGAAAVELVAVGLGVSKSRARSADGESGLATAPVRAGQLSPDSVFARLAGNWVLRGTMARQQTTHDVSFTWMLGREYLQMHEVSRERTPAGVPAYEAVVLFGRDPKSGEYACIWMDNTEAAAFPPAGRGHGFVAGDSLSFLFDYSASTAFHNTFVYHRSPESWDWHLDNDSAGVRKPFARVTLTRQ